MTQEQLKGLVEKVAGQDAAAALGNTEEATGRVVAQARGANVSPMQELARQHQIPLVQDFAMSNALRSLPPGTLIPDEIFQCMATVLDFVLSNENILEAEFQETRDITD